MTDSTSDLTAMADTTTSPPAQPKAAADGWLSRTLARLPAWSGALAALVVLCLITAIMEPAFLKPVNLLNILNQNSAVGIVAVGMTLVIILGGIDLSVGSLLALA